MFLQIDIFWVYYAYIHYFPLTVDSCDNPQSFKSSHIWKKPLIQPAWNQKHCNQEQEARQADKQLGFSLCYLYIQLIHLL